MPQYPSQYFQDDMKKGTSLLFYRQFFYSSPFTVFLTSTYLSQHPSPGSFSYGSRAEQT